MIDQTRVDQIGRGNADFPTSISGTNKDRTRSADSTQQLPRPYLSPLLPGDGNIARWSPGPGCKSDPRRTVGSHNDLPERRSDFGTEDPQGRPDFPFTIIDDPHKNPTGQIRGLTPRFLAYSQGYSLGDDSFNPLSAEVRPWPGTPGAASNMPVSIAFGTHPMAFVTAGAHRNLFSIDATSDSRNIYSRYGAKHDRVSRHGCCWLQQSVSVPV